jgi:hypothetical protein
MEHEKAIAVLKDLLEKQTLTAEQKEAVMTAIGMLSWGMLTKSRLEARKVKRDKNAKW